MLLTLWFLHCMLQLTFKEKPTRFHPIVTGTDLFWIFLSITAELPNTFGGIQWRQPGTSLTNWKRTCRTRTAPVAEHTIWMDKQPSSFTDPKRQMSSAHRACNGLVHSDASSYCGPCELKLFHPAQRNKLVFLVVAKTTMFLLARTFHT